MPMTHEHLVQAMGSPNPIRAASRTDTLQPNAEFTRALSFGSVQEQESNWLGSLIFTAFPQPNAKIRIVRWGNEHKKIIDTERPFRTERARIEFAAGFEEFDTARFGLETGLDPDEIQRSDNAFRLVFQAQMLIRMGLALDEESRKAQLAHDPLTYPVANRFDLSGAPWTGAGDPKADIKSAVVAVKVGFGGGYKDEDFMVVLSEDAWKAAQGNVLFQARSPEAAKEEPSVRDLINWVFGNTFRDDTIMVRDTSFVEDGVEQSLWPAFGWVGLRRELRSGLDMRRGREIFGLDHTVSTIAFSPYFEDRRTVQYWPVERRGANIVHNSAAAAILFDMI